jgi:hypothetical protein
VGVLVLSLEEVKLYLKVDGDEDNTLITDLISAAEELCQDILRHPFAQTQAWWHWILNQLSIPYAFRPRVRSRLTLGGRAFPRNP